MLALLIGVSLFIVGIDYFTLHDILITTTEDTIENASGKVGEQISGYLQPLGRFSSVGAKLISKNIITPEPSVDFMRFLYAIISGDEAIVSAFWADTKGNLYELEKSANTYQAVGNAETKLVNTNIIIDGENTKSVENIYDSDMNFIGSKEAPGASFDPRPRPWYQQAKFKKRPVWSVYPLIYLSMKKSELGINAAYPVYDKSSQLRGIFGVEMPLGAISTFVENIKVTKNSIVFICDDQEHLITAYRANVNLLKGYKMPKLDDLGLAWAKQSFSLYRKTHKSVFIYSYDNKKYIAAYEKMPSIKTSAEWNIAIVTPYQDIVAPLQRNIFFSFIFIFIAVVLGIIFSIIFSSRISRPIVKLAKDAELICQLRLMEVKQLYSRIKEICYMADSFMKMKSALSSFQRYMPTTLVKNLISSGKVAEVGGETKEMTLLFSDIEDFTPTSESMSPQKVMQYLSEYFQAITKIIINTRGTVDKYIGDGAMAFWGAPIDDAEHALHACQAAVRIQAACAQLNNRSRIGINTGQVIVGNVGSDDRLSYTALGDDVNLASRLENLNKEYKTYTLVSENTYRVVKDYFKFRLIDKVAVKGKKQGSCVYELLGEKTDIPDMQLERYNQSFREAFTLYERGEWEKALQLFSELAAENKQDYVLQMFVERCQVFCKKPPENWTGIWIMDHK